MAKHRSGARTYSRHLPLKPVEGKGVWIRDEVTGWLIDCIGGAGSAILGWAHPAINRALQTFVASGAPLLSLDFPTPLLDRFTAELAMALPRELAHDGVIHLCAPSGANAVEAALTVAEIATGNSEHIALEGSFHGCSKGARAVSSASCLRRHSPMPKSHTHFLPFPQDYRCPFEVGGAESVKLAIRAAERAIVDQDTRISNPASLIVECVQGEGGSIPAPHEWLRSLRNFTECSGIPMIADEVQAGMGRTGAMWSFEHSGIVPDIVVISKGLGGGVPIAVIVLKRKLNRWKSGAFTGTFRGNALGFASSVAVMRYVREQDLARRALKSGQRFLAMLQQVRAVEPCIGDVRGLGLMLGAEVVNTETDSRGVGAPAPGLARRIQRMCFDLGLLVEVGGVHDNVVRFLPPLVISEEEIDSVVDRFATAVRAITRREGISDERAGSVSWAQRGIAGSIS